MPRDSPLRPYPVFTPLPVAAGTPVHDFLYIFPAARRYTPTNIAALFARKVAKDMKGAAHKKVGVDPRLVEALRHVALRELEPMVESGVQR